MALIFDIEADDLLEDVSKIHCLVIYDTSKDQSVAYTGNGIETGLADLASYCGYLIGHNIAGYDIPAIKKLNKGWTYKGTLIDTMLAGCILYPEDGILSLENWTEKLGLEETKVQNDDWSQLSNNMVKRCEADVMINKAVYEHLISHEHYDRSRTALLIEQEVALIHAVQTVHGVRFNVENALKLYKDLDAELTELHQKITKDAPWYCEIPGVAKCRQKETKEEHEEELVKPINPFKKGGNYTVATNNYFGPDGTTKVHGSYTKVNFKPFNPDSSEEVQKLLLDLGWRPTEWNTVRDKMTGDVRVTSPKLTEDSFHTLPQGLGKDIARYQMLSHRKRWLLTKDKKGGAFTKIRKDGRVSATAFTCGTPTARYRHNGVVCNIPRVTTPYGREMRSCLGVADNKDQVGVDLSGIEARMLAHYLLAGNYSNARATADLILSPDKKNDFHSFNAKQWGVDRNTAKSVLYALMYGAGAKKLAIIAGYPENKGAKLKKDFYRAHPGIAELIKDLERAWDKKKWIKGIDGRPLMIRSKNRLLNSLLQNAAAIVFKRWMVQLGWILANNGGFRGLVYQIIAYHDELQYECYPEVSKRWANMCEDVAVDVGETMELMVPIEAEAKIGRSWADCH